MGESINRLVDFDDGFDCAEGGIGEFFELGWNLFKSDTRWKPFIWIPKIPIHCTGLAKKWDALAVGLLAG
jgi:hypothetical protein